MEVIKREYINPLNGKAKGFCINKNASYSTNLNNLNISNYSISYCIKNWDLSVYNSILLKNSDVNDIWEASGFRQTGSFITAGIKSSEGQLYFNAENGFYTIIVKDNVAEVYLNGIKVLNLNKSEYILNNAFLHIGYYIGNPLSNGSIYNFRLFNYALSETEVKALYNGGRPDKYVLDSSYKNIDSNNILYASSISGETYSIRLYKKCTFYPKGLYLIDFEIISELTNSYTGAYDIRMYNSSDINTKYIKNLSTFKVGHYYEVLDVKTDCDLLYAYSGSNYSTNGGLYRINSINRVGCIAEYLPSSLTSTQWRDTSGQGNHLTTTGEVELLYDNPTKELIEGTTAPTIIPDFKGQEFKNTTDNSMYVAKGTSIVNDWIKII